MWLMASLKSRIYHNILFSSGQPPPAATTSRPSVPSKCVTRPSGLAQMLSILYTLFLMQLATTTNGKEFILSSALLIDSPPAPYMQAYNLATSQIQVGWKAMPDAQMYNLFWVQPGGTI